VREALTGLLSPSEVESTVSRFRWVKDKVQTAKDSGLLKQSWDQNTAREQLPKDLKDLDKGRQHKNYLSDMAQTTAQNAADHAREVVSELLPSYLRDLPEDIGRGYTSGIWGKPDNKFAMGVVWNLVYQAVLTGLPVQAADQAAESLLDALMSDNTMRNQVEITIQEQPGADVRDQIRAAAERLWPSIVSAFSSKGNG